MVNAKPKKSVKPSAKPKTSATRAKKPAKRAPVSTTPKETIKRAPLPIAPVVAKLTPTPSTPVMGKRIPVVVVLGHVDHGKSSLLEAIRDFKITAKESGGITQHIGAYEVDHKGQRITFIDTPGHEAFSAMRLRGAEVADISLLVVDAAQSVQPQTKEAIMAIRKAEIPMVVVLNKIDLPNADPEKIKRELMTSEVYVESMGGEIPSVEVSAKEKKGIDELLEIIALVADLQDLSTDLSLPAEGVVIESRMDALKGPIATIIVEKGTLSQKAAIATDSAAAKVRQLLDFTGRAAEKAMPGAAAVVLGFETVPGVGERFKTYPSLQEAQQKAKREMQKRTVSATVLEQDTSKKTLNLVLKADVFGSLEAIEGMLKNLPQDQVTLRILKSEVGEINESDAKLAEMSGAEIIGFRVKINPAVMALMRADTERRVRIKTFTVIYELIQQVRSAMEKSLEPEIARTDLGKLKTLLVFWGEKNRQIVGGKITEGEMKRGAKLEVIRDNAKVGTGKIVNLQRDKKDIDRLSKGDEAGILFEGTVKIEKGDIIVAYTEEKRKGEL